MLAIPQSERDITASWLATVLADTFGTTESDIQEVAFDRLGEADSVSGTVLRARLRYRDAGNIWPPNVIVKLPRTRETRSAVNNAMYSREVEFYRRLAPAIGMSIPHAYYSAIDADSGDYVLVLEDFPALRAGKNEDGASASEARVLLTEMAALHARWWGSRELDAHTFLATFEGALDRYEAAAERLPIFLERHGDFVQPEELAVWEALGRRFRPAVAPLLRSPRTLIHGDLSLKNTLAGGTAETPEFVILDWQLAGVQPGARDVSFFVGTRVAPEARTDAEAGLLRYYHSQLEAQGVRDYSFHALMDDYRRSVLVDLARMCAFGSQPNPTAAMNAVVRSSIRGRTGSAVELRLGDLLA